MQKHHDVSLLMKTVNTDKLVDFSAQNNKDFDQQSTTSVNIEHTK